MENPLDNLKPEINRLGDTGLSWYDADTLYDDEGQGYRLRGYNAFEVGRFDSDQIKEGEIGGDLSADLVRELANKHGFTNIVETGEMDSTNTRKMIDLEDDAGRSFTELLTQYGVGGRADPRFDPNGDMLFANRYREALRTADDYEENDFDIAAKKVDALYEGLTQGQHDLIRDQKYAGEVYNKRVAAYTAAKQQGLSDRDAKKFANEVTGSISEDFANFMYEDRDATGEATNPLGTSWNTGMEGAIEGARGMQSLIGEKLGIDSWVSSGEAGVLRARARLQDQGRILTDYKDVDGFMSAIEFAANNAVMSLPYFALTGVAALTSPMIGAGAVPTLLGTAAALSPAAVYSGQVWNEMGDQIKGKEGATRSASIAIASGVVQAVLDRFGFAGIFTKSKASGALLKELEDKLVRGGSVREEARAYIMRATKEEIGKLMGDVVETAKGQLKAKAIALNLAKRIGIAAPSEASTEAMQEFVAAVGADIGSGQPIDWNDVADRMIHGAIAGGVVGGAFSMPGAAIDAGQWANIAYGKDLTNPEDAAESDAYANEEKERRGYVPTASEAREEIVNSVEVDAIETLNDAAEREGERRKKRGLWESITEEFPNIPFLRGSTRAFLTKELQRKYRAARVLADNFGGRLQRVFGGSSYENSKHHLVTLYKNMISKPDEIFIKLNNGQRPSLKRKQEISDQFYSIMQGALDQNGQLNEQKVMDEAAKIGVDGVYYVQLAKQLDALAGKMWQDQTKYNPDLGRLGNYLLQYKAIDKGAVHKNRKEFIDLLVSEYGRLLSYDDAVKITDQILNTDMELGEAFSVIKGGPVPASHQKRTLGLSRNKKFNKFMERDLIANVAKSAKSAARYIANQEYVGHNGKKVMALLEEMRREGATQDEIDKVAFGMKRYLDAESGNYKRPTSDLGKRLQSVQKNFMFFTTLAALPLATLSSIVELALTQRGLTGKQIFGKDGGLATIGKEFAEMMHEAMKSVSEVGKQAAGMEAEAATFRSDGRAILRELGYYDWDVGAATTTGVSETHAWQNRWLDIFFKAIGLQGWTNYTRAVRASIAGDFIRDNINVIMEHAAEREAFPARTPFETNEVREAKEKLRNLGLSVDDPAFMKELLTTLSGTDNIIAALQGGIEATGDVSANVSNQLREAYFNFINEAVVLPQAANRPLIYQDPRYSMFNQFQGFISTFSANHIPRMYDEYLRRGSPAMKYNTYAMMMTMIMLGFASQYLKDLIKHGKITHIFTEEDLPGILESNPYLDPNEMIQRGLTSTGIIGVAERPLEWMFPIYEQRTSGPVDWFTTTLAGESAMLSNLGRMGKAAGKFIEGEGEEGLYQTFKMSPVTGPFTASNKALSKEIVDLIGGD